MATSFLKRCRVAFASDPIRDFAKELLEEEVTEQELARLLVSEPSLRDSFRITLIHCFRDVIREVRKS